MLAIYGFLFQPSNDRDWAEDQKQLATAEFDGDLVHVRNVRNISYRTTKDYTVQYYNATYNLSEVQRAWFLVEPFSDHKGAAHTLVTFEFADKRYLAVSVEIRKEKGEQFSAVKGLFRQYELMYVVADEEDVIKLRSNYRNDTVYLYPANTSPTRARAMLVSMLKRANTLAQKPAFYNTLVSTCTTNIVRHVNIIAPGRIAWHWKILAPAYADEYALSIGLLAVNESTIPEARAHYRINERAWNESGDFSTRIRK